MTKAAPFVLPLAIVTCFLLQIEVEDFVRQEEHWGLARTFCLLALVAFLVGVGQKRYDDHSGILRAGAINLIVAATFFSLDSDRLVLRLAFGICTIAILASVVYRAVNLLRRFRTGS